MLEGSQPNLPVSIFSKWLWYLGILQPKGSIEEASKSRWMGTVYSTLSIYYRKTITRGKRKEEIAPKRVQV